MELLPLHKHESLVPACIDLLNAEWPRSKGARSHSLSKSCDNLPVALALCMNSSNKEDKAQKCVIGFSKLSGVQGQQNSCLLESVVIRNEDRGKGFGRILMERTEVYAKKLGIKTAYLNTTDKVGFYSHLGYIKCNPVISLGENAHRVPDSMLKHFLHNTDNTHKLCNGLQKLEVNTIDSLLSSSEVQIHERTFESSMESGDVTNSAKIPNPSPIEVTSQSPSPPAPPPPPPPPPILKPPTIVRLDPTQVTWMKKDL